MFLALCLVLSFFGCDDSSSSSDDEVGIVIPRYSSTPGNRNGVSTSDVVLASGNTCTAYDYKNYHVLYADDGAAVGVVAYKGKTGDYGTTGKIYMIGLNEGTDLKWAPDATTGFNTKFSTSDTEGEGNWAVIGTADAEGAADAAANYPAFNYAKTYTATGYSSGWFLPSKGELYIIYLTKPEINQGMDAIIATGGTAKKLPTSGYSWSSSQSSTNANLAWYKYLGSGGQDVTQKNNNGSVRVVHTLD